MAAMTLVTRPDVPMRQCGDCTLCCKLVPMKADQDRGPRLQIEMIRHGLARADEFTGMIPEFDKPAGARCPHQSRAKGCKVYARRPHCCRLWSCRWLVNDDTAALPRPDRARYVIDIMPDLVTAVNNETGESSQIEVIQIWVDPAAREAWRDPALLYYLTRRGSEGKAAIIRYSSGDGFVLFPPTMSDDHQWHEVHNGIVEPERTPDQFLKMLGGT